MQEVLFKRHAADEISRYLQTDDIIVLHGARQVGKTHILYYFKNLLEKRGGAVHYIDLEDSRLVRILDAGVSEFLDYLAEEGFDAKNFSPKKKLTVFIDEIQYLTEPSSFLKLIADHHKEIKLFVSGSSSFNIKTKFKDSLAGRTVNFDILNLSFQEFLMFRRYHFDPQKKSTEKKTMELKSLYREYVLFGGYPKIALTPEKDIKERYIRQIIDTYVKKDVRDLAAIKDISKFNRLLEILASQSGQLLNVAELANTCGIAKQTVENYLFILEETYIIKIVRPFFGNLRSELSKTPKIFFYDTGLMHLLWLKQLPRQILGQSFETSVFAELAKTYGVPNIFYWRTADKKEIDFVVKRKNQVFPMEVKINFAQIQTGSMRHFCEKYKVKHGIFIALEGVPKMKNVLYPWGLASAGTRLDK